MYYYLRDAPVALASEPSLSKAPRAKQAGDKKSSTPERLDNLELVM